MNVIITEAIVGAARAIVELIALASKPGLTEDQIRAEIERLTSWERKLRERTTSIAEGRE